MGTTQCSPLGDCGPRSSRRKRYTQPLPKIHENESLPEKEQNTDNIGQMVVENDTKQDIKNPNENQCGENSWAPEDVKSQSGASIDQLPPLHNSSSRDTSYSSGNKPGVCVPKVSISFTPPPVLQRHCSQWEALTGYFQAMNLQTEQLEKMWNDVKKESKKLNQNELSDEELLLIISNYLKMCQREAKSEFKRQKKAIHKVKEQMISVVTPPAKINPLVKGMGMATHDPMDYESQARAINLENVLHDEVLDSKTRIENEIYGEKMNEQFTIDNFYGKDTIGDTTLRERVGMVIKSCNHILYCIDKEPEKVLRNVKAKLLQRGMFCLDSRSESSSLVSRRSREVSMLKHGIGKQVFFENINGALRELYADVGMEHMKKAAPRPSNLTDAPKTPIPRLLGGPVVITVFCETPENWRLPWEMQMKIGQNTAVGSVVQFVLDKYGTIPPEVMICWRDELLCSIVEPGTKTTVVDWEVIVTGLWENQIQKTVSLLTSILGVAERSLRCMSYKACRDSAAEVGEANVEEEETSKEEKTDSSTVNTNDRAEGSVKDNRNSRVQTEEKLKAPQNGQPCFYITYKIDAESSCIGSELRTRLLNPDVLADIGFKFTSELFHGMDAAEMQEVQVKTETISTYVENDSESVAKHRMHGTRKIVPPDSFQVIKTGSIVKLSYVDRGNID